MMLSGRLHACPGRVFKRACPVHTPAAARVQQLHGSVCRAPGSGVRTVSVRCSSSDASTGSVPEPERTEQQGATSTPSTPSPSSPQPPITSTPTPSSSAEASGRAEPATPSTPSSTPSPHPEASASASAPPTPVRHPELDDAPSTPGPPPSPHPEMSEEAQRDAEASGSGLIPDSLPLIGSDTDWREFRARLVAQQRGSETTEWAHPIPKPEPGALLLAHPMQFTSSQQYFYQSVILLLHHDEGGSFGVILNRPSQYTLGQLSLTKDLKEFDGCRLFVGGDVGDGTLRLLHAIEGIEGSVEVVKGVYTGGIEAVRHKVAAGEVSPDQCRWFARYAGWGAGQLERECRSGVWFTAAASPDLILQLPKGSNGREFWHQVLKVMGGNYKLLSETICKAEANAARSEGDEEAQE